MTGAVPTTRILQRKLNEIMNAGDTAQQKLDRIVKMIADTMVAEVCSIYLKRGTFHELFATAGLKAEAVHTTRLKENEGLVGLVAETGRPVNLSDAPVHPRFSYKPETGEEAYTSFLGVPIMRSGRVSGVLVVQNSKAMLYGDEEIEALQNVAMVLMEMVSAGRFGDLTGLKDVELRPHRPERLVGRAFADGIAIGVAVLHEPHVPVGRVVASDPVHEEERLDDALARVRHKIDRMLTDENARLDGESRDLIETFRILAGDHGWEARLRRHIRDGLSAEAAVDRARADHRARLAESRDPFIRDQMHEFEDLDNRVLRALASPDRDDDIEVGPNAILIARDIGSAELLEYGLKGIRGAALEGGGPNSHAAIVANALGVPMVGRLAQLGSRIEQGDAIVLDGERGEVRLRPEAEVVHAYEQRLKLRSAQAAEFARQKDVPSATKDGRAVTLLLNAGLLLDMPHLADTGAAGVGLFRTEFNFMVAKRLPTASEQAKLYADVLDAAGDRPVTFRTLDVGGDKLLPYAPREREENPALGWRAVRFGLDREGLMRPQLRALVDAAEGRHLRIMFPLVTVVDELIRARALLEKELQWAKSRKRQGPARLEIGVMVEAPAFAYAIRFLKGKADFLSVGTNDLMQYFFAADRGNPNVAERYDILSAPALRFLDFVRAEAALAGLPLSICGDAAGRPLEAMAFIALGFNRLSMPAAGVGPVKRMLLSLDAAAARAAIDPMLESPDTSIRPALAAWAKAAGVAL